MTLLYEEVKKMKKLILIEIKKLSEKEGVEVKNCDLGSSLTTKYA